MTVSLRSKASLGIIALLLAACGDGPAAPVAVASLEVSAPAPSVVAGQKTQLSAVAKDASGNVLSNRAMTWSSDNQAVATVDGSGLVSALTPGSATIAAGAEGQAGRVVLTVTPVPVASVAVFPLATTLTVGAAQPLSASVTDATGNALTGRTVAWASGDPGVASVSASGVVTAVAPGGPVAITATVEGKSAVAQVTVIPVPVATLELSPDPAQVPVGGTVQLTLIARDQNGAVLAGRTATLTSSNAAVATVNAARTVTGVSAGAATITATAEGKTATATVHVVPGPVVAVEVAPQAPPVRVGAVIQLSATTRDASGAVVTGRTVTWTSSDPGTAAVSSTGAVTGVSVGTATITATSEGKSGTTTVSVLRMPVAGVRFDPFPSPSVVGDTVRVRAVALDSTGRELPGRMVTYSGSGAAATVSSSGFVSALGGGTVTITATSEGKSAVQDLSVADVRPSFGAGTCLSVSVGASCTSYASLRYVDGGRLVSGGPAVDTITSSNSGIARTGDPYRTEGGLAVRTNVTVTGVAPGPVTLTATYVGANGITRTDTMTLQVNP